MAVFKEIIDKPENALYFVQNLPDDQLTFPAHNHDDFELTLSLAGRSRWIIGGDSFGFEGCDLTLIGPGVTHCLRKEDDLRADLCVLQFSRHIEDFQIFTTDVLRPVSQMLKRTSGSAISFPADLALRLREDLSRLPDLGGIEGVLLFLRILHTLSTCDGARLVGKAIPGVGRERIDLVLNYIHSYYKQNITLSSLGGYVGLCPETLCRYFKSKTGLNLGDYLRAYRVNKACELLRDTDKTVAETAFASGFNSLSSFGRAFLREMQVTPTVYRKMFQGGDIRK